VASTAPRPARIVVLDVRTGEVLALANLPTYNPNNRGKLDRRAHAQPRLTDLFEPGLDAEAVHRGAALEAGIVTAADVIQTAPGGSRSVAHDPRCTRGALTVAQVIQKSSNVGAAKMALAAAAETMWELFRRSASAPPPSSDFPARSPAGCAPKYTWKPIEQATMSYGHGISVSLLQLARAYTIFAATASCCRSRCSSATSRPGHAPCRFAARPRGGAHMLEMAVQPGGTAPRAQVAGYRVAARPAPRTSSRTARYAPTSTSRRSSASRRRPIRASDRRGDDRRALRRSALRRRGGRAGVRQVMAGALRLLAVPPDAPHPSCCRPPTRPSEGGVIARAGPNGDSRWRSHARSRSRERWHRARCHAGRWSRQPRVRRATSSSPTRATRRRPCPHPEAGDRARRGAPCCGKARASVAQRVRGAEHRVPACARWPARSPHESTAPRRASLWMVGVTGTNGKTSCSQWIAQALTRLGRRTASSARSARLSRALEPLANTTPDALELQRCCAITSRGCNGARAWPWKCLRTARAGPRERREVRRRAVHQPHARPPRLPRRHGGVRAAKARCSTGRGSACA
jgi:hypothetical protein